MKRALSLTFAVSLLLLGNLRAEAALCTQDEVPGATLLLPYFEVDLDAAGNTDLLTVHNASKQPVLVHLLVWSDLSVPVLVPDFYINGLGTLEVNLQDLLRRGHLPVTHPAVELFPGCPSVTLSQLPPNLLDHLQKSLTGKLSSTLNECAGRDLGDNVARGYITIDTVSRCSVAFPSDPGYFENGGLGIATNQNVLWGSHISVDAHGRELARPLIALEASSSNPQTSTPGSYTFYGRFVAWKGDDNREPLATHFGARFLGGAGATDGTDLIVWRDPRIDVKPFNCPAAAGRPVGFPLPASRIQVLDVSGSGGSAKWIRLFPAVAQRVNLQNALPSLPVTGTIDLDLNARKITAPIGPARAPYAVQGWVTSQVGHEGAQVVDLGSVHYDSACESGRGASTQ